MKTDATMNMEDLSRVRKQAEDVNSRLKRKDGSMKGDLGKDSFLKLLVTELRHQDPTQPMQDREFISQMATFSSLEQMTNINGAIQDLYRSSRSAEAYGLLGKTIQGLDPVNGRVVEGTVSRVFFKDREVRLAVGNRELGMDDVYSVFPPEKEKPEQPVKQAGLRDRPAAAPREEMKPAGVEAFFREAPESSYGQEHRGNENVSLKGRGGTNDIAADGAVESYRKSEMPAVSH
ncbi:MAG TPA: hypothetical protein ENN21_11265 [Spirochaetes bacterium]|nr:hypothetical protein [Spirochaetota bacterium]